MRVLIAGCGYVGTQLGRRLAGAGHDVWGLRRSADPLPAPIRTISADLLAPDLRDVVPAVDRVVYAASADETSRERYRDAYVRGPRRLLEALSAMDVPPDRFIFVSSTAVYGDAGGDWVDERTKPMPEGFRGELVLQGERIVRDGAEGAVVLRLGGIYGPGRTRLVERVRSGEARCPGGGPLWSNRIHRDDAASAIHHLLAIGEVEDLYLGVDDEPSPICDVYRFVADLIGAPVPEIDADAPPRRSNKRCSNLRLRSSGLAFGFPSFREGYRGILAGP